MNDKNIKNMYVYMNLKNLHIIVAWYLKIIEVINLLILKRPPICLLANCSHEFW